MRHRRMQQMGLPHQKRALDWCPKVSSRGGDRCTVGVGSRHRHLRAAKHQGFRGHCSCASADVSIGQPSRQSEQQAGGCLA